MPQEPKDRRMTSSSPPRSDMPAAVPPAIRSRAGLIRDLCLLLVLATLWGASYSFIKIGIETIPPLTLIAARTVIAGAILLAILAARGLALPRSPVIWRRFLIQACLNSAIPFTLIAWAEQTADAGLAVILNATTPIFTFLMTMLITRHEPAEPRKLFGVAAGMVGICLIVGLQSLNGLGREVTAQLSIVAASVCYAGAAIFGKNFKGLDPMMPAAGSLVCGATILVPFCLAIDHPWTLSPSAASLGALLALAVFSTALAFSLYFHLVQSLGSVGTSAQGYLRVPIGVAIGIFFLGENLSEHAWLGLGCVLVGVIAMTIPSRRS